MSTGQPIPSGRGSPPSPSAIRPFHLPPVRSDRLGNGLAVRSMARTEVPLVSIALVLDVGEAPVPAGREGIAVFAGDGLQGGTARRSGVELAEGLERLGSDLRVATGWDATTVAFTCLAERLDEMLALLSEVVREPAFPQDEVERIRRQRLADLHRRRMEPARLADDELLREMVPDGQPYGRPLLGTPASVESLDAEGVRAFVEERYGPVRGGLVAVGDLSEERVADLAARHFGEWGKQANDRADLSRHRESGGRKLVLVNRPGAVQSELRVGHLGPPRGTSQEDALRVANSILGGAFTSRLNLRLREERGFTYGVRSRLSLRRDGGTFTIGTSVDTGVTAEALAETMEVFDRFVQSGPSEEEVTQARDYLAGVFPLRMETTAQLAARLAELLVFDLPDDHHHTYRDRIRAVDAEAAGEAAAAHLRPDRAVMLVVGDAERVAGELEQAGLGELKVRDP